MRTLSGMPVGGVSVGGFASTIDLPELKVCVDVGQLTDASVARETVLITHGHADHIGSFAQHVAQRGLRRLRPATYLVPPGLADYLEELLAVWRRMDRGELPALIKTFAPGEEHFVRKNLVVRAFQTVHRVASQGYAFEEVRTRLATKFHGASSDVILAARGRGEDVDEAKRVPLIAVTGDTTIEGLTSNPELFDFPRLVMEATFLDDRIDAEQARARGHVHLDDIAALAGEFRCDALLLNHVSPRHSRAQAVSLIEEALPENLVQRTQVMIGDET